MFNKSETQTWKHLDVKPNEGDQTGGARVKREPVELLEEVGFVMV